MADAMQEKVRQFNLAVDAWAKKVPPEALVKLHRMLALDAFKRIKERTPVGNPLTWAANQLLVDIATRDVLKRRTRAKGSGFVGRGYVGGTLRRNNQVAIGFAPETSRVGVDPTGAVSQAEAEAVVAQIGPFQRVTIFNNVEYGKYVEDGSSRQAPAGMYRVTFEELRTQFQRVP